MSMLKSETKSAILRILLHSFFASSAVFVGGAAFAVAETLCDPITGRCGGSGLTVTEFIGQIAIRPFLGLVGAVAFALFVYGGALMMFSAGSTSQVEKGIKVIRYAVIGLFIIFSSSALVKLILDFIKSVKG